jgi:hypothetical protein
MDALPPIAAPAAPPPHVSAARLLAHPRFPEAVALLTDRIAALYGGDRRLIRELFEYDRAVTFFMAICIAAGENEDNPNSWLTVSRLAAGAALMGIGSPRRVRRFVEEMRSDGHLVEATMEEDRRRHRLRPTEQMLAVDRQWVAAFHAPLALLIPEEPRYRAGVARDPGYHWRYRAAALLQLSVARATVSEHVAVDSFLHQAGGARILTSLMQSSRRHPEGWSEPGFYSLAAESSATTRVHARNMLRAAAAAGYVEIAEAPTVRVRPMQVLRDDYDGWVADSLSSTDLTSALTLDL